MSRARRDIEALVARLSRYRDSDAPASKLSVGERAWLVEDGRRVVHTVLAFHGDDGLAVEMRCGTFGEIPTPSTRRKKHPFVTRTTLQLTCVTCLAEEVP